MRGPGSLGFARGTRVFADSDSASGAGGAVRVVRVCVEGIDAGWGWVRGVPGVWGGVEVSRRVLQRCTGRRAWIVAGVRGQRGRDAIRGLRVNFRRPVARSQDWVGRPALCNE